MQEIGKKKAVEGKYCGAKRKVSGTNAGKVGYSKVVKSLYIKQRSMNFILQLQGAIKGFSTKIYYDR